MVIENSELKLLPPSLVTRPSCFGNILAALVGVQPGSGYETSCRPQEGVRDLPAQRGPYLVSNLTEKCSTHASPESESFNELSCILTTSSTKIYQTHSSLSCYNSGSCTPTSSSPPVKLKTKFRSMARAKHSKITCGDGDAAPNAHRVPYYLGTLRDLHISGRSRVPASKSCQELERRRPRCVA